MILGIESIDQIVLNVILIVSGLYGIYRVMKRTFSTAIDEHIAPQINKLEERVNTLSLEVKAISGVVDQAAHEQREHQKKNSRRRWRFF